MNSVNSNFPLKFGALAIVKDKTSKNITLAVAPGAMRFHHLQADEVCLADSAGAPVKFHADYALQQQIVETSQRPNFDNVNVLIDMLEDPKRFADKAIADLLLALRINLMEYANASRGKKPDWALKNLVELEEEPVEGDPFVCFDLNDTEQRVNAEEQVSRRH
ncbi:MAG TPA: hypothetical protein V6C52_03800 [Coleofasciculaceae cyanobacterium]|jgi:hypothetical protein